MQNTLPDRTVSVHVCERPSPVIAFGNLHRVMLYKKRIHVIDRLACNMVLQLLLLLLPFKPNKKIFVMILMECVKCGLLIKILLLVIQFIHV